MDSEMMRPFPEITISQQLDTYNRRKKEGRELERAIWYCKERIATLEKQNEAHGTLMNLSSAIREICIKEVQGVLKILEGK